MQIIYLTIIPQAHVGYEMVDSQQGAYRRVGYNDLISNKCKWNNCFIKNTQRIAIFELPSCFRWRISATISVLNGIWAYIPLAVNQSKCRHRNIPLLLSISGHKYNLYFSFFVYCHSMLWHQPVEHYMYCLLDRFQCMLLHTNCRC